MNIQVENPPCLQVNDLTKEFTLHNRDGMQINGFSGVSFSVRTGELLALTGPSGVGKSSILKTVYRTYTPSRGTIWLHRGQGKMVNLAGCSESEMLGYRRRHIGFVTQFLKILPRIPALDVVAAPLIETGTRKDEARERAAEMLRALHIREELFSISPLTFSGGEQQRINIARGIIAPKKLLLLDEPTASLDEQSASSVLQLLQELKRQKICMVAIFHDRERMVQVADNEYHLEQET
ncbi:alpha-D-ribose 1-methylphosphonate 5-triphosphate synthase subunit PhnL [Desulfolithobacter dissulfuricans]|uniref:Alpha-D-ribose 1-methylphosphonate 5-triphosphate synthase subunit PhnL n=1 Tax=Desulfolithobacter dissulfuricans TaxID=2795293 RepID=A0A915XJK0_9BACT|nr:phosphonate C-P lyase system protein PhnL [Desulfolithobacter dissulfuricans]BCO10405.1 alpha-D-ribose 1-methylphosphonate 5-triphosphate synthase subunit PhnL [Desulfolithobacter dissulfuricans]